MDHWIDLYVNSISPLVTALGPGRRIGLWLQGCSLRCPGCMSPEFFERGEGFRRRVPDVFSKILSYCPGHSGLTVSGGEPFEQVGGLKELLFLVRSFTALDILIYSGYTLEELLSGSKEAAGVLSLADVLIDGRYCHDLPTDKPWMGSSNQRMHLLSHRAQSDERYNALQRGISLQVEINEDDSIDLIGIPRRGDIDRFRELMLKRGIELKKYI